MRYSVCYHPDAESALNEAAEFLDHESPGLGLALVSAVERAVDQIQSCPQASTLIGSRVWLK